MSCKGTVPYRYCRFPATALSAWKKAVADNRTRKKQGLPLLEFNEPWMPKSQFFIHCQVKSPFRIIPQQDTRFHTGWVVGQMDLGRAGFHNWIERYKLLLTRELDNPNGAQGIGNAKIRLLMEKYFPGKLDRLRQLGERLPFVGRNCIGKEAFNDPDVVTFDEQTRIWGFYEVKREEEVRKNQIHTNQAASLGFLKDFFGDSTDAAFIIAVAEGNAPPTPSPPLLQYDFTLK